MLVARLLKTTAKAICLSSDAVGDLVYATAAGSIYTVTKVDPAQYATMPALACIVYKITATSCVIQFEGDIPSIYSGLTPGKVYFVGADGRPNVLPPTPGLSGRSYIQPIGIAVDTTILRLNPVPDMKVRVL